MTNVLPKLPAIEIFFRQLLLDNAASIEGLTPALVDGDFRFNSRTMPYFVQIARVSTDSTQLEADFAIDVEVFARKYHVAEDRSLEIERVVLGYPHGVRVGDAYLRIDRTYSNTGPSERPWGDEGVTLMGATYALSIRRT